MKRFTYIRHEGCHVKREDTFKPPRTVCASIDCQIIAQVLAYNFWVAVLSPAVDAAPHSSFAKSSASVWQNFNDGTRTPYANRSRESVTSEG